MNARDDFMQHFLRHEADLKAFIGSLVLDAHLRADVFQEVALTLWQQIDSYDPTRSFGAWARGVAANKVLQMRQRSARFPIAFAPETIQAVLDAYERTDDEDADRAEALRECVRLLPEKSRRLLQMRYEENLPGEEIARQLAGSLEAIYQSLSRIRARLEECIRRRLAIQERMEMDPVRRACDLGRRYLDGLAGDAERAELEQLLRENCAAADAFAHLGRLEANLLALFSEEPGLRRQARVLQAIDRDQRRRRWRGRGLRLALAASLLMLLGGPLLWWLNQPAAVPPPMANHDVLQGQVLVAGAMVEHLMDGAPFRVAGSEPAVLRLSDGSAARLRPGSRAVLYGRSRGWTQRIELIEGEGRFTVKPNQEGFRVDTALGWVTALGTEFTVKLMKPDRGDPKMTMQRTLLAVVVFAGLVRVETEDGNSHLLGMGERRVFGQERSADGDRRGGEGERRPVLFRGTMVEVKDGKLVLTMGNRRDTQNETFEVAQNVTVFIDDKEAKWTDLPKGALVAFAKNEKGAITSIRAVGRVIGGTVKSVAAGKLTLVGRGRGDVEDPSYALAKDVKVVIGRDQAELEDVKEGMLVALHLSVDGKTVRGITRVEPRGDGGRGRVAAARVEIKDFDAKANTITLPGRGADQTIELPRDVKVTIDGKPGKLADLAKGSQAVIARDEKGAVTSIQAVGPLIRGVVRSLADGKLVLASRTRDENDGPSFPVAKDVKVTIDGKPAKLEDVKERSQVVLQLSMDGKTVLEIFANVRRGGGREERPGAPPKGREERPAAPPEGSKDRPAGSVSTVAAEIRAIDAKSSTITVPGGRDGDDRTFTLAGAVKVTIDGKPAKLVDLKVGSKAALKLDGDGKTVLEITVGEKR